MKAKVTTKVLKCEGRVYQGYSYDASVELDGLNLHYILTGTETVLSKEQLKSVFKHDSIEFISYTYKGGKFTRLGGVKMDIEYLEQLADMCEGLPVSFTTDPAGGEITYETYLADHAPDNDSPLSVYVTNLGKYNEGELCGRWLNLPTSEECIESTLDRIGIGPAYEEYFISDSESPIGWEVGEFENIYELNELAERIADLEDYALDALTGIIDNYTTDMEEAVSIAEDGDFCYYLIGTMEELAEQLFDEGCFGEVSKNLEPYIDFARLGRDLELEGQFYQCRDGIVEVLQ